MTEREGQAVAHPSGAVRATLCLLAACAALGACSSSFGSGGGSAPQPAYVVLPSGETVRAAPVP